MTRLIDADALIEAMNKFSNATGEDMTHGIFYAHIAPTIDAESVRHGKWIKADSKQYFRKHYPAFTCSECGQRKDSQKTWNYCPNCGARMDKE